MDLNIHYSVHKNPPRDPVMSQINPVHILTQYFSKIHFNIILPFTPRSPFRFPQQNIECIYSYVYQLSLPRLWRLKLRCFGLWWREVTSDEEN